MNVGAAVITAPGYAVIDFIGAIDNLATHHRLAAGLALSFLGALVLEFGLWMSDKITYLVQTCTHPADYDPQVVAWIFWTAIAIISSAWIVYLKGSTQYLMSPAHKLILTARTEYSFVKSVIHVITHHLIFLGATLTTILFGVKFLWGSGGYEYWHSSLPLAIALFVTGLYCLILFGIEIFSSSLRHNQQYHVAQNLGFNPVPTSYGTAQWKQ